jgi:hypothetical protein
MIDIENYIARRYRERVFAELTPTDFNEILLDQIDELHSPIKIGPLEFKASEIIKQLRPDALENYEIKSELLGAEGRKDFDWYTSILENNEYSYCWLDNPDSNFAADFNFFKYEDCHRIMKEVKDDFLQQFKNDLLQENKDLLQKVMKELLRGKKFDNPIEIEIYSEDKSVRKFLNSNGEESFRAVETPEPIKISNPISNLISEEVITETFAALKAANIEEVTVSFSSDSDGCPPVDWIKFEFNEQGVKDLIKNKKSRKGTLIRENLRTDDEPWHLEVYEYHFEEANIPNLKCTKELWNILVSFVYKEYETLDNKAGGYVIWRRNLVILDACENVKLRNSDPWEQIPLFASGKYVRQYGSPEPAPAPQEPAPATSMSDKQKEAIKYSFDNLLYSLGEWIDFDKHGGVPSCFCPESIMRNIDHLLEAFPDICKDLAVKKYSEVKSYMDEYSKDRDEKENRV